MGPTGSMGDLKNRNSLTTAGNLITSRHPPSLYPSNKLSLHERKILSSRPQSFDVRTEVTVV